MINAANEHLKGGIESMECKVIQEQLLDCIDKKLSAKLSQKITNHLLNCETCEKMYRRHQKTHQALKGFGEAVRVGVVNMEAPPLPSLEGSTIGIGIWDRLKTPVPVWIPSAASVAVLLMFAVAIFSPLNLSMEWGKEKGGGKIESTTPPLAAESLLEFLIVPDPTDLGQLAASIETVETFLKAHPKDVAMHAKLVELYQAKLKQQSISKASRIVLLEKLSMERERLLELLKKQHLMKGD